MGSHAVVAGASDPAMPRALFVAEAPGRRGAARTVVPLTGDESGRRFHAFLALADLQRAEVFVTNAMLCNPLDALGRNRSPRAAEIAQCSSFLRSTLALVDTPIVVALGRSALLGLTLVAEHRLRLAQDVGRAVAWHGMLLVPLYHPGRQSTVHRSMALQEGDWRRLGRLLRRIERRPSQDSPNERQPVRYRA